MSETVQLELTPHERELVLEGLRCVRSSRRFEFRNPLAPPDDRRENDIRDLGLLIRRLEAGSSVAVSR